MFKYRSSDRYEFYTKIFEIATIKIRIVLLDDFPYVFCNDREKPRNPRFSLRSKGLKNI